MIVQYVRKKERPVGVVVATSKHEIGWSLCNERDKWDRKRALEVAEIRAVNGTNKQVPHSVMSTYNAVKTRADKYYK